ncbi:hypothetical protein [Halobellus limi]|jgi:hypothetical protein|uniref:DUF7999 domain-containing protein n=1 Tax=Halobellus limi TaxID=699433 RepID=A0A1H5UXH4_9EURY|nr:hypothetical protein [Halobellus limi]QCC46886.1 hypothetical protein DV707_03930 [Halobellus limi]SEF79769.1 hypothetical protein SAMN04488133_0771 [Halobellus limi]
MSRSTDSTPDSFTVVAEMNSHDAVTVRSTATHATYHLVDFADDATREALSSLSVGESVRLDLSRVGRRGNVWRADDAASRSPAEVATESAGS